MKRKVFLSLMALSLTLAVGCGAKPETQTPAETQAAESSVVAETTAETVAASAEAAADGIYTGFASGKGFAAHGDVCFANVEINGAGEVLAVDINAYYGMRSIGRLINNIEKAKDNGLQEELDFVDSIAEDNKIYSEDGKYVNYKYMLIDGKVFECTDSGKTVYKEIGDGATIENLQEYLLENTDWWCGVMEAEIASNGSMENNAILKVAEDGDEVVCEIGDLKLAKMGPITTYYGTLTKKDGYSKNFSPKKTAEAWNDSITLVENYIVENKGITDDFRTAAETVEKDGDVTPLNDVISGASLGYPTMYINVVEAAIENAKSNM